jgi:hypothetical protein
VQDEIRNLKESGNEEVLIQEMTAHGKELVQIVLALIGAFCFGQVYGAWMWSAAFTEVEEGEQ